MNTTYPDRHHPVFFLQDALNALGIRADFARDARTLDCWGLLFPDFDNRLMVWLIDNRLPHEQAKEDPAARELLQRGVLVCHAQKPDAERVGGHWLPLAASPGFRPIQTDKLCDVAMVGYVRDQGRMRMLSDVAAKFRLNVAQGVFGEAAVQVYCGAHVGLNIVSHYGQPYAYDSWNMRAPEIMACGIPLVTEYQPYLEDLGLNEMQHYLSYNRYPSFTAVGAIDFALANPAVILEIGEAGRQLILDRHTYRHRAEQVKQWLTK